MKSLLLPILLALLSAGGAAAQNAPTVTRPAPYPNYRVGGPATLIVDTSPPQIYAPVWEFRYKNGQPDGPQPEMVGFTDGSGSFVISISSLPAGVEGTYTNERYAVGSPYGPKSSPALNFTISPETTTPLAVTCGCEHFTTPYDQICEARPWPNQPPSGGQYRYRWSVTGGYFPSPPGPFTQFVHAECLNGPLRVSVAVDLLMGAAVVGTASTQCVGGTPVCG